MIKFCDNSNYLKELFSLHTNLSDFYYRTEKCYYFYITEGDLPIGFIQFKIMGSLIEILFVNAKTDDMRKELMTAIVEFADYNHLSIEWRIISEVEGSEPKSKDFILAENLGFSKGNILHIFKSFPDVYDNLSKIVKFFDRLSQMVSKMGFTLSSFQNLSDEQKKYICENPDGEFADFLQSGRYIKGEAGTFNEDMSFVALKDGKPVAYTVVRTPSEKRCIFENNSVANSYKNSGVLAMVWGASLKMLLDSKYESITFAVYEDNEEAYPMVKKRLASIISQEKLQINYFRFHNHERCEHHDNDSHERHNG